MMLLQYLGLIYSVSPVCLPFSLACISHFTASLPSLTVRLLIRRSVSQAVLSFCLNIHLLSVYLHLRKNLPGLACAVLLPSIISPFYLSNLPAFGFPPCYLQLQCFAFAACLTSLLSNLAKRFVAWRKKFSFPSDRWS